MTVRKSLPPELPPSFRVGDALDAGVSRKRLMASDLQKEFHGARSRDSDRRAALVPLMSSGHAFCGPTAAAIWELPIPRRWETSVVHVSTDGASRMRRPGVVGSRRTIGEVLIMRGMPVLDPVSTWISLGPLLDPWDLTAVADRLVSTSPSFAALADVPALHAAVDSAGATSGVRALRRSLEDARVGAWSRPESLVRILIARCGLPEPVLNQRLRVDVGAPVFPDLAWPEYRIALEYDGRWHDDPSRFDADLERFERFADVGWIVIRVHARDLFSRPSELIARLVRRLASRGYVSHTISWSRMPRFEP